MQTLTLKTEKLVHGGKCLAHKEGHTFFISGVIPGEIVEISLSLEHKNEAKLLRIIEKSPFRATPVCPLYGECGGCDLMHIEINEQRRLKAKVLAECFTRQRVKPCDIEIIYGKSEEYRARFRLHEGKMMKRGTNSFVSVTHCPVAENRAEHYLASPARKAATEQFFASSFLKNADVVVHREGEECGRNIAQIKLLSKDLSFDVSSFFQSNMEMLEKTVPLVTAGCRGKKALDMYAGAGIFSLFLLDSFENVEAVELSHPSVVFARRNLLPFKERSKIIESSGKAWANRMKGKKERFDFAVIDGPRGGAEKEVLLFLAEEKTPLIKILSCDAATHARDAALLISNGYRLTKLFMLDFFPHTHHIESLGVYEL